MNHFIQIYSQEIITALTAVAVILMGANIGQYISAIVRKHDIEDLEDANRSIVAEMTEERVKREQADVLNEELLDEINATRRKVDTLREEMDEFRQVNDAWKIHNDAMKAERATLYRRNAKGQIEPITPKPRKAHTLRHGMTVKDPTPKQAKTIFKEARKAGIHIFATTLCAATPNIWFGKNEVTVCFKNPSPPYLHSTVTYITPTEFIRRIKGEVE